MSRQTFYDLFSGREDCLLAILQDTVERIEAGSREPEPRGLPWRERVCAGLGRSSRSWIVSPRWLACVWCRAPVAHSACWSMREEILAGLASAIDQGRHESARAERTPSLTAEGLVGAVVAIVYKRLLKGAGDERLTDLLGGADEHDRAAVSGSDVAGKERDRLACLPVVRAPSTHRARDTPASATAEDPLKDVPMRITYRTARVLQAAAGHPGASNRLIGEHADTYDQGQVSKLLGRLQRLGLLENAGGGQAKGEPNAWSLTALGRSVTEQLALDAVVVEQSSIGTGKQGRTQ